MEQLSPHIYTFILPVFLGNLLHLLIVKHNYFQSLAKPVSVSLFGFRKTYRAFLLMPPIWGGWSLLFRSLILHEPNFGWSFLIGYILGFIYLLTELPNSFIKRRLGVAPGTSHKKYKTGQYIIDKIDSLLPLCIFYYFITGITAQMALLLFTVLFVINVTFSVLIYKSKIKIAFKLAGSLKRCGADCYG